MTARTGTNASAMVEASYGVPPVSNDLARHLVRPLLSPFTISHDSPGHLLAQRGAERCLQVTSRE